MPLDTITDEFSIRTGAVRLRDLAYLLAGQDALEDEDVDHTAIFEWDPGQNTWGGHTLDWTAGAACVCAQPKEQLVVVGDRGEFLVMGQGETYEGRIPAKPTPSGDPAPFRGAREIGGKAYAVGMNSQVFRRDDREIWTALDKGLAPDVRFEAIDGYGAEELYAVGWEGALWCMRHDEWMQCESGTNLILTGACCAGDESVYVCGQSGVLLRGRGGEWEHIRHETVEADFWDVEWFNGELYVSSAMFLYRLTDQGQLAVVGFDQDRAVTCSHLSTRDGVLWSIGQRDVMAFDGERWERIT